MGVPVNDSSSLLLQAFLLHHPSSAAFKWANFSLLANKFLNLAPNKHIGVAGPSSFSGSVGSPASSHVAFIIVTLVEQSSKPGAPIMKKKLSM